VRRPCLTSRPPPGARAVSKQTATTCAVWAYTGSAAGHVNINIGTTPAIARSWVTPRGIRRAARAVDRLAGVPGSDRVPGGRSTPVVQLTTSSRVRYSL
jgi:hypothetical protein